MFSHNLFVLSLNEDVEAGCGQSALHMPVWGTYHRMGSRLTVPRAVPAPSIHLPVILEIFPVGCIAGLPLKAARFD